MKIFAALVVLSVLTAACGESTESGNAPLAPVVSSITTAPSTTVAEPVVLQASVPRSGPIDSAPVETLADGFNQAGYNLWLAEGPEDNFVFSPLSIGHALLMARAAADQATGESIDATFGLPPDLSAHQAWNALDAMLSASADRGEIELILADRIWPDVTTSPDQGWVDLLAAEHGASSQVLDLRGDPDRSAEIINEWVSDQTQGLIEDLIKPDFLTDSILVLTNAIYFEAKWQLAFGKYGEITAPFDKSDGSSASVSFMVERELADLRGAGDGWVAAEIPYRGSEYSMLIIIPDEGQFEQTRERLTGDLVQEVDQQMSRGPYELRLPKWETDSATDLLPWLTETGAAPGSYPLISPPAFLGGAVHGANIAVDEFGTVAAAATALEFGETGPPEAELDVFADQPFLYLIRHRPTGAVLFAGQVMDPTA